MRTARIRPAVPHRVRSWLATAAVLTASTAAVLTQAGPAFAAGTTLYAAPSGSGTACSASRPCSVTQAKSKVRAINNSMTGNITVELADGTYRLSAPLAFTSADSGTGGHTVNWKAALGAHPVITGARKATGWTVQDPAKNIWKADVGTGFDTRQLYVDGILAPRARTALTRSDLTATTSGYTFTNSSLSYLNSLAQPGRTEIHGIGSFTDRYAPVTGISNGTITMEQPQWTNNTFGYDTLTSPFRAGPLYVENAYEFLDTAGEWYLDTATGTLYYKPLTGQNMRTADVEVPKLESLIGVGGTYSSPATHIAFSGLQFSGTSWLDPTAHGYASQQTGAYISGTWDHPSDALTSCQSGCRLFEATRPHWDQMPSAVQVSAADHITFTGNRFTQLGQSGLGIGNDASAHTTGVGLGADTITATGNVFTQDAGGGIVGGGVQADAHHPSDSRMTNRNITLTNNLIHDVALEYRDMSAILVTYVNGATVSHNEVYNLPYSGLTIGYGWGTNDIGGSQDYVNRGLYNYQPTYTTATTAANNHVTDNYIHDLMQQMTDGGCMYTLSASPGSTFERNYCHSNNGWFGFYHDEGSRNFTDTNNVFRNTGSWGHENGSSTNNTGALTLTDNWTNNSSANITNTNGRGDVVSGTVVVTNGNWPSGAKTVMDSAGIQPLYRPLTTDPVSSPYSAYSSTPANTGQSGGRFTITDAGEDIWGAGGQHEDAYGTVFRNGAAVNGTSVTARVDNLDNTDGWAKAGVVLRNDLTDDGSSPGYAAVVVTPNNGVSFQRDRNADGYLDQLTSTDATIKAPVWLRLTRTAKQVSAYYSTDGSTFTQVGPTVTLPSMATTQDAGVIHTAHSTTAGSATFSNLRIVPSPDKAYSSIPAAVSQGGGVTSLTSAGIDVWRTGTAYDDEYAAAYRTGAAGTSSTATVHVDGQDKTSGWAKAGLMLRNNITSAGSSTGYLVLATTPDNGIVLSSDSNGDGYLDTTSKTGSATAAPVWLRLVRSGTSVTGSYSANGTTWTTVGTATLTGANSTLDAGMFSTAHAGSIGTATFSQFSVN